MTNHEPFLREALRLALRGRGFVSPNPMVGAVVVKAGRIVGRGWHERFGGPHAEINALPAARAPCATGPHPADTAARAAFRAQASTRSNCSTDSTAST